MVSFKIITICGTLQPGHKFKKSPFAGSTCGFLKLLHWLTYIPSLQRSHMRRLPLTTKTAYSQFTKSVNYIWL